jgi:hypothetical protein
MLLASAASGAYAQSCAMPVPFLYEFQSNTITALAAANPSDPCVFGVAINAAATPTASDFLHYRRAAPVKSVRYGFRVDTSTLIGTSDVQHVQLFAAASPSAAQVSNLLTIGFGRTQPTLTFIAAASGAPQQAIVALTQSVNTVRVEISVGSGANGIVHYWINHPFSDPADGVLDRSGAGLDNAAWIGVLGAELGLSSASDAFRANQGGHVVTFDQLESSDDVLFWSNFTDDVQ